MALHSTVGGSVVLPTWAVLVMVWTLAAGFAIADDPEMGGLHTSTAFVSLVRVKTVPWHTVYQMVDDGIYRWLSACASHARLDRMGQCTAEPH